MGDWLLPLCLEQEACRTSWRGEMGVVEPNSLWQRSWGVISRGAGECRSPCYSVQGPLLQRDAQSRFSAHGE